MARWPSVRGQGRRSWLVQNGAAASQGSRGPAPRADRVKSGIVRPYTGIARALRARTDGGAPMQGGRSMRSLPPLQGRESAEGFPHTIRPHGSPPRISTTLKYSYSMLICRALAAARPETHRGAFPVSRRGAACGQAGARVCRRLRQPRTRDQHAAGTDRAARGRGNAPVADPARSSDRLPGGGLKPTAPIHYGTVHDASSPASGEGSSRAPPRGAPAQTSSQLGVDRTPA